MKKKLMHLGFLTFSLWAIFIFLWAIFIFSCGSSPFSEGETDKEKDIDPCDYSFSSKEGKTNNIEKDNGNANSSTDNKTVSKKKTREEAFLEVIKVLHAPYESGDRFFKIFTCNSTIREKKDGFRLLIKDADPSIKDGDSACLMGNGSWFVVAGKDNETGIKKDDSIVYTYEEFQPKGSKIIINGEMIGMYRSKGNGNRDAIGFNKHMMATKKDNKFYITLNNGNKVEIREGFNGIKRIKDLNNGGDVYFVTLSDVLTIRGSYKAKLEFIYPHDSVFHDVTEFNYEERLIGDFGMFTGAGSSIEFTYDGETKELTKEEIEKLIIVA